MGSKLLTEAGIKAELAKAVESGKRVDIYDRALRGLVLRVTPKGAASFAFAYRPRGTKTTVRITIGSFPLVTLAQARKAAEEHARALAIGRDPAAEKKTAKAEAEREAAELEARISVAEGFEKFLRAPGRRPSTITAYQTVARKNLLPPLGKKALADVSRRDIQAALDDVMDRGAHQQAGIVFGLMRTFFNWTVSRGYIERSPLAGLRTPATANARARILSVHEIRAFWRLLPDVRLRDGEKDIFRLQLLLGQRIGEVAGMRRSEIELERKVWTLPAERSKNKKAHEIPLPPLARQIIEGAMQRTSGRLLFPAPNGQQWPADRLAMRLLRRQPHFDFRTNDDQPNTFTSHDLRRTVATWMEQSGTPLTVVSAVLNHTAESNSTVTSKHYAHADLLKAKRLALTKWEADLRKIFAGEDPFAATFDDADAIEAELLKDVPEIGANVITFPGRAAS